MWQKSQSEWDIDKHSRQNNYGQAAHSLSTTHLYNLLALEKPHPLLAGSENLGLRASFHSDTRHNYDNSDKRSVSSRLSDLYDSTPQSHSPPQDPTPTYHQNGVAPSVKLRKKIGSLASNSDSRRYSSNDYQSQSAAVSRHKFLFISPSHLFGFRRSKNLYWRRRRLCC